MFPFNQSISKRILAATAIVLATANSLAAEDFSVGIKARYTVSSEAHSYAFRYIQANKLISLNGNYYATYLENDFDAKARTLDPSTGTWVETGKLGTNGDDHGGAAIAVDNKGYFHAAFGGHGETPFRYVRSSFPGSISQWGTAEKQFGSSPTYPSIVVDKRGVVHITYRAGEKNNGTKSPSENAKLYYQYKLPNASAWSQPRSIAYFADPDHPRHPKIDLPVNYGHFHHSMVISPKDELFILLNFFHENSRPQIGTRSRHVALIKTNLKQIENSQYGKVWQTVGGNHIGTPKGVHPNSSGALVHDVETTDNIALIPSGLTVDKRGHPWVLIKEDAFGSGRPSYQFLKTHDGEEWSAPINIEELAPDGMEFSGEPLSISVSENDVLYLAGVMNGGVGLLYGKILNGTINSLDFVTIDPSTAKNYRGVTLERSSNGTMVQIPLLGYGWCNKEGLPDCHAELVVLTQ